MAAEILRLGGPPSPQPSTAVTGVGDWCASSQREITAQKKGTGQLIRWNAPRQATCPAPGGSIDRLLYHALITRISQHALLRRDGGHHRRKRLRGDSRRAVSRASGCRVLRDARCEAWLRPVVRTPASVQSGDACVCRIAPGLGPIHCRRPVLDWPLARGGRV